MKKYNDLELCELYKEHKRLRIVAEIAGCSDETVRRALIKHQIPRVEYITKKPKRKRKPDKNEIDLILSEYYGTELTIIEVGEKFHRSQKTISEIIKKHGTGVKHNERNSIKITDDELITESKTLSCREIAKKHNMSEERVFRRAGKIGVSLKTDMTHNHWKSRSSFYDSSEFDETINLEKVVKKNKGICQICGKPIDWNDIENGHIKRNYPTVDHIIPFSKGGTHTWDNVQLAHMSCNAGKCDRTSEDGYTVKKRGFGRDGSSKCSPKW